MGMGKRCFYEVLSVERGASEADIKSAFRKQAMKCHPDRNPGDKSAEHKFKEINEAYEVLKDADKRAAYDRFGHAAFEHGGMGAANFGADFGSAFSDLFEGIFGMAGARRSGRERGADLRYNMEISLDEAFAGKAAQVRIPTSVACEACSGTGAKSGTKPKACPTCGGAGRVREVSRSVFGEFVRTQPCPQCSGRGVLIEHPCKTCDGVGRVVERRELNVDIPAGIHDGQRIRISGEGHAGVLGGRAGDVYVLVHVKRDARFVREGNDVFSQVDLTIAQAALGAKLSVETLDGPVELELPAGVQPGEVRVLRGRGMPVLQGFGRGDHRVLVNVRVPRRLSEAQRKLLEELEATSDEHTYAAEESFFDKLKSAFR